MNLFYSILILLIATCCVSKKPHSTHSGLKNVGNFYFNVETINKNDTLVFYFFDSIRQKIDTGVIIGMLEIKFKNKDNQVYSVSPLLPYKYYSVVPNWINYDICELTIIINQQHKKIKFYNEREDWDGKTGPDAPWRGLR